MGTGYIRQASAGIVDGFIVEAADLNAEYNRLEAAFNGTTGHAHDGTTGNGPQIDLTTSVTGILPDSHLPGTITGAKEFDDPVTFNAGAEFPNADGTNNGISLGTGTSETNIQEDGIFAREGGTIAFRPNGLADTSNQATLTTAGLFTATSFAGVGTSLTALNASNLASGTVPVARVSGSYTGITGTGALNAGSITSGFGNIDIGGSSLSAGTITSSGGFSGNGSSITSLNASNISSGTISDGLLPSSQSGKTFTTRTTVQNVASPQFVVERTSGSTNVAIETKPETGDSIFFGLGAAGTFAVRNSASLSSAPWFTVTSSTTGVNGLNVSGDINLTTSTSTYYHNKATSTQPMFDYARSTTSSGVVFIMRNNTAGNPPDGTQIGSITVTSSATAYNTSSDERMKDFIGNYDPDKAIEIIRSDPVRDFTWKSTGDYAIGWGAQTSYSVSKDLASPPVDEEGVWGVDQGKRTPYLWAAMSKVLDRIDELEARIAELEAEYEN